MGTAAETLTQPQELPVEPPNEAAPKSYEHTHVDGTVHRAESAESARAACPVLGKMAVEQADLLLEIAALGQQKMKEEQVKEQPKQLEPENIEPKQKPEPKDETAKPTKSEQTAKQEPNHIITTNPITAELQPEQIQQTEQTMRVKEPLASYAQEQVETADTKSYKPVIEPQVEEPVQEVVPVIETVERAIDIIKTKTMAALGFNETIANVTDATPLETIAEQDDEQTLHAEGIVKAAAVAEPELLDAVTTIEADEQFELRFDTEVIDTYREISSLTEGEISTAEPSKSSDSNIEATDAFALEAVEPYGVETVQDFELAVVLLSETDEVMPLETIVEQADEQPLEQTFVQLAQYLAAALPESQTTDDATLVEQSEEMVPEQNEQFVELNVVLREIAKVLPGSYYMKEETGEQSIKITPELTEQLLLLLHNLGYENPREVLVEFVRLHGLTYLLQALQYMCQMNNENERKEVLAAATLTTSSDDKTNLGSQLGNAVLSLLAVKELANENVVTA